jgi:predicted short-subunit dehydrogenase-like oxidoreductase (DUF2520 family)
MNVGIIGLGRLGLALAFALLENGINLTQIATNKANDNHILALFKPYPTVKFITRDQWQPQDLDLVFLTIADDYLYHISKLLPFCPNIAFVHCSGSVPLTALEPLSSTIGVLYPLQTFSLNYTPNYFNNTPFFIESNQPHLTEKLSEIAALLNKAPNLLYYSDSIKRLHVHVGAVFVNNFTNFMVQIGEALANDNQLPPTIYHKLLTQTVANIKNEGALSAQSGPARRGDSKIILAHRNILEKANHTDLADVYVKISELIYKKYH